MSPIDRSIRLALVPFVFLVLILQAPFSEAATLIGLGGASPPARHATVVLIR